MGFSLNKMFLQIILNTILFFSTAYCNNYFGNYGGAYYNPRPVTNVREAVAQSDAIVFPDAVQQSNKCRTTDNLDGICLPVNMCFSQYDNMRDILSGTCTRNGRQRGVCCPLNGLEREPQLDSVPFRLPIFPERMSVKERPNVNLLDQAIQLAMREIEMDIANEKLLIDAGIFQRNNTQESFHQGFFGHNDDERKNLANNGIFLLEIGKYICRLLQINGQRCTDTLRGLTLDNTNVGDRCQRPTNCDANSLYRSLDGSCNNLNNPTWGRAMSKVARIIPSQYNDGLEELRRSVEGPELPNVRLISSQLTNTDDVTHPELTVMFLQFSQFVTHDITLGLITRAQSGQGLSCCNRTANGQFVQHEACAPIVIPRDDPFYSRFNQTCMNFVRTAPVPNCDLGAREQPNAVTAFIDASQIYGSDTNRSNSIRTFVNGKLRTSMMNGRSFMPLDTTNQSIVCRAPGPLLCLTAGDFRSNQQFGLVALQLMFFREHNRICDELKRVNPGWTDETIFQEARKIVGAQLQWITYNEFLPLALGRRTMKTFGLLPSQQLFSNAYDMTLNPTILNEFSSAAFRWHTLTHSFYTFLNENGQRTAAPRLRDSFNDPTPLYRPNRVDQLLRGLSAQPTLAFDPSFTVEINQQLFPTPGAAFGGDLVSINLQRGRDHGIPPYTRLREICGLPRITSFMDLDRYFRPGSAALFQQIYRNVDDIDLFIAGLHEKPLSEGILGPTFACIVADQFRRLKMGDRFWFENAGFQHSFTEGQLNEIRKTSLSRIVCNNADNIETYPALAFVLPSEPGNPYIACNDMPQMDLTQWRQTGQRRNQQGNQRGNRPGNQRGNQPRWQRNNQPGNQRGNRPGTQRVNIPGNQRANTPVNQWFNQQSNQQGRYQPPVNIWPNNKVKVPMRGGSSWTSPIIARYGW